MLANPPVEIVTITWSAPSSAARWSVVCDTVSGMPVRAPTCRAKSAIVAAARGRCRRARSPRRRATACSRRPRAASAPTGSCRRRSRRCARSPGHPFTRSSECDLDLDLDRAAAGERRHADRRPASGGPGRRRPRRAAGSRRRPRRAAPRTPAPRHEAEHGEHPLDVIEHRRAAARSTDSAFSAHQRAASAPWSDAHAGAERPGCTSARRGRGGAGPTYGPRPPWTTTASSGSCGGYGPGSMMPSSASRPSIRSQPPAPRNSSVRAAVPPVPAFEHVVRDCVRRAEMRVHRSQRDAISRAVRSGRSDPRSRSRRATGGVRRARRDRDAPSVRVVRALPATRTCSTARYAWRARRRRNPDYRRCDPVVECGEEQCAGAAVRQACRGDASLVDRLPGNSNSADLCCVSVQSPPVTSSEVFGRSGVGVASEYDEEE